MNSTRPARRPREYESRLLDVFPRTETEPVEEQRPAGEPEWWMTGAWVTVPPERAEQLTEDARSFANEFAPKRER